MELWIYIQVNDVSVAAFEPIIGSPVGRDPSDDRTVYFRVTTSLADTDSIDYSLVEPEVHGDGHDLGVGALLLA